MGKIGTAFRWVGGQVLVSLVTGSALWERIVAAVAAAATTIWGVVQDVPVAFIIPLALIAAGAALWVLDQVKARQQFKSLAAVEKDAQPPPDSVDRPLATRQEIAASSVISRRTIRAWDMIPPGGGDSVVGKVFDDCVILGPAVVVAVTSSFRHANWGVQDPRHLPEIWIQVSEEPRFFYGVMYWKDCVFKDCWFGDIGLLGSARYVEQWLQAFRDLPRQQGRHRVGKSRH